MNFDKRQYKAAQNTLKFIYHLRCCKYYAKIFIKDYPESIFTKIFKLVLPKIDWIANEFITNHNLQVHVPKILYLMSYKWNSDFAEEMAIDEKITLLSEEQQVSLNEFLDALIAGEDIKIKIK